MENPSFTDDLRRYAALIWHWAWLLVLISALAGGAAYFISKRMTPVYQATTTVLINEAPATKTTDYTAIVTSERLAQTYAQLMTKQPVLQGVIERLGLTVSPATLKQAMQVSPVRDTTLIEVRVEDKDPEKAALIANAVVSEFSEQNQALQSSRYAASKNSLQSQLDDLEKQIQANTEALAALGSSEDTRAERDRLEANQAQYRQTYAYLLQSFEQVRLAEAQSTSNVIQAEPATAPATPVRPRTLFNTVLAALVGLMAALGAVFLAEAMDDSLKSPDEVTRQLGLPVLGLIGRHSSKGEPVTQSDPRSPTAEAFRSLRTNIQYASVDRPIRTLLITSPSPAEGKSTIVANLALAMAQNGRRVVIIDADLRRPRIHQILNLKNQGGVSGLIVQPEVHLNGTLLKTTNENLSVLNAGDAPPNPAELLGSEKMLEIIRQVSAQADMIVVDSPPVLAVTDSSILAPRMDGVILVLKPDVTQLAAARQAVEQLKRVGARLLGVVLNEVDLQRSRYYFKGYYHNTREYFKVEKQQKKRQKAAG